MATKTNAAEQIQPGTVTRALLNTTTAGSAVVAKLLPGTNVTLSYTGVDAGTGDVTVNATSVSIQQISLNFGLAPVLGGTFTFTATGNVGQRVMMLPTADGMAYPDELEMDSLTCACTITATNTFVASVYADPGPITGSYNFNLMVA